MVQNRSLGAGQSLILGGQKINVTNVGARLNSTYNNGLHTESLRSATRSGEAER